MIEEFCTITAKGQTTVPKAIRQALGVGYGGRIAFRVDGGQITIHAVPGNADSDHALAPFLALLEDDLSRHPGHIQTLTPDLKTRIDSLVPEGHGFDPDDAIEGDVAI